MFRQLPNYLMAQAGTGAPPTPALVPPAILFDLHPQDIVTYMEAHWNKRPPQPPPPPQQPSGHPDHRSDEGALPVALPTTRVPPMPGCPKSYLVLIRARRQPQCKGGFFAGTTLSMPT